MATSRLLGVYPGGEGGMKREAIHFAVALLFVMGAALQLNDPDPGRWIAIYLAAALSSAMWGRWKASWLLPALVGLAALAWGLWIAAHMVEWVQPQAMFEPMQSRGGAVEQSRELFGLAIIAAWMTYLGLSARKIRSS